MPGLKPVRGLGSQGLAVRVGQEAKWPRGPGLAGPIRLPKWPNRPGRHGVARAHTGHSHHACGRQGSTTAKGGPGARRWSARAQRSHG
jgi:hypothetical protein